MSEPSRQVAFTDPSRRLLVAIDAGGTSTRSVLVEPSGRCVGYGRAGSGNPTAVGLDAAAASVATAVAAALDTAGVGPDRVDSVLIAMAGARTNSPIAAITAALAQVGVDVPLQIEGDLLAVYFSGTHQPTGCAMVAGTGAAAIRVEDGRQVGSADGLGWLLGDDGSGFWIGHRVVHAALADLDRRGPATALTAPVLRRLDLDIDEVETREDLVLEALRRLYAAKPVHLASFAPLAFEATADPVAQAILEEAGDALSYTLAAVAMPALDGPVVLGGSILAHHPELAPRVVARLDHVPQVRIVGDGLTGAATLALRHAAVTVDEVVHATIRDSLAPWLPATSG